MHAHVALVAGIVAPGRSRTDRDAAHLRDVELAHSQPADFELVYAPPSAVDTAGLVDATASPERLLGWVQLVMGLLALFTLPVYDAASRPLIAAIEEQITNAAILMPVTLMPARRAASALPPTA